MAYPLKPQRAIDQNDGLRMIYNNVYMGDVLKYNCESSPVKDEKNKTTKYVKYTFTVDAMIFGDLQKSTGGSRPYTPGDEYIAEASASKIIESDIPAYGPGRADDVLSVMKKRLLESRKSLFIFNSGFGNIFIQGDINDNFRLGSGTRPFDGNSDYIQNNDLITTDNKDGIFGKKTSGIEIPETNPYPSGIPGEIPATADADSYNLYRHRDVQFGPEPDVLKWEPIGGRNSARVVFEISFYVKDCLMWRSTNQFGSDKGTIDPLKKFDSVGLLSGFIYNISYEINEQGFQTRTIEGQAEITNNTQIIEQKANRNIDDYSGAYTLPRIAKSADDVRDTLLLKFQAPDNYKRTAQRFVISEDRSVLSFRIVDTEINGLEPYPKDVIELEVTQDSNSKGLDPRGDNKDGFFIRWDNSIEGTITLAPGVCYSRAWVVFCQICLARLAGIYAYTKLSKTGVGKDGQVKYVVDPVTTFPIDIQLTENLYGNRNKFKFKFSWITLADNAKDPANALRRTGLFTSIGKELDPTSGAGSSTDKTNEALWGEWKESIDTVEKNRGISNLKDEPNIGAGDKGNERNSLLNTFLPDESDGTTTTLEELARGTSKNIVLDTCISSNLTNEQIAVQQNLVFKEQLSKYEETKNDCKFPVIPMFSRSLASLEGGKRDTSFDDDVRAGDQGKDGLLAQNVNEGHSLVSYECKLQMSTKNGDHYYQRQMPKETVASIDPPEYNGPDVKYENQAKGLTETSKMVKYALEEHPSYRELKSSTGTRSIARTRPQSMVALVWEAKRVAGPCPAPKVIDIGGAPVELLDNQVESQIVSNDPDFPIYKTAGIQILVLKGTPDGMRVNAEGMPSTRPT